MAKTATEEKLKELRELVNEYAVNKKQADACKKIADAKNKDIKTAMNALELTEVYSDKFKVTLSVRHSESMDEEKVLDVLINADEKLYKKLGIIKMKPYIDEDALESAIYLEKVSPGILQKLSECKVVKDVPTLTIKEIRESDHE